MNIKKLLLCLLLLVGWASANLFAQTAVTVGSQVTDVDDIVSGKAYLLRLDGLTGTPYVLDTGGDYYGMANNNTASQAAVYYLISDGNGGYKIENAYTGKYWPTPSSNGEYIAPTTAANAGTYTIAASGTANRFTFTCTVSGTAYHTNRSSSKLVAHTSDSPVSIYEVTASTLATAATYTDFTGKEFSVSASEAANISEGQWYVMSQRSRTSYVFENTSDHKLKHTLIKPSGSATEKAGYLVRLLSADGGKYYLQNGFGNYMGVIAQSTNVPTTAFGQEAVTVAKIGGTDGHFYLQGKTNSVILDGNDFTGGDPSTVVGWGTGAPTSTGGNNDWAFYPVEFVDAWNPAIGEVYTINNTNSNRGALIYNPENPKYVWSSGKSGTFDATNVNSQWVIIPSGTAKQYYLYNVGAGKFAIPTAIAQGAGYPWIFSDNAVAVIFETQSDGTKKIKMASTPVNGSNAAYMAVSNNYTGPIINYNDVGGNFTIAKVEGVSAQTQAEAAVGRLVKSQTALTSYPQASGWYAIQIKSKTGSDSYAGRYLQTSTTLYNDLYPLTFTGGVDVQPAITDPSFLTYIEYTSWDKNKWQLPDGRYLVSNSNSKFPTPSATAGNVICGFDNGNYFKSSANYYADPYNNNANYFIGETTYMRTAYTVYPVDLAAAGLTAWKILSEGAPETAQITCSRSDVHGLTSVYNNGYIFLPSSVTPASTDFTLDGATEVTIDANAKTVTLAYNPSLAIVADGVTVAQGYQTAGRGGEVMLLKVNAAPFRDATDVSLSVGLKDGSEANISSLTLYEASSSSPEILSAGNAGAPTKTQIATTNIDGSSTTATLTIGNLSAGTHYYWLGATVKSDATLGAIIDAAITDITYTCNANETTLDLTAVGDPSARGAMVFNAHSYPFLPRENGSRVYRIPAMIVADDGSIIVACDKRYDSYTDIGNGHVIDIVIRRSTDGGKTWGAPVVIAKGLGSADDAKCGYGDPSLVKGKDGKIYCLFVAGNLGYFYGQKRVAMSTSSDNGVTWSSNETTPPIDLYETGRIQNGSTVGEAGYGLYDYFVTSGRGLYIPEDDILMYLIPAQTMTSASEHTSNSQDYIFYSTDGGEKWYFSESTMFNGGDEAKIIQMNDGSLLGSVRQSYNRGFNTATYTKNGDGTLSFEWGTQYNNSQLSAGGSPNNQDIFYYQRETKTGKTDVIFHSMTTGQHANFKLYYSTDGGRNWTDFLTVQTKGTRYVTMERSGSDENPGSLYLFFEDQSLNEAGGYTDYNHYPLNFLEITRDQLVQLIPELDMWVPDDVTIISQGETNSSAPWGTWTPASGWANKFTTNANSGKAGVEISATHDAFNRESDYGQRVFCIKPSAAGATDEITITAPEGFVIKGYSIGGHFWTGSELYTLTSADGLQTAEVNTNSGNPNLLTVDNIFTPTTTFSIKSKGSTNNRFACITTFNVSLIPLDTYARTTTPDNFGTLCLPYDALSYEGATFYKVAGKKMENDVLSYITLEEVTDLKGGVGYLFQAGGNELTVSYCVTGAPAGIEPGSSTGLIGSYESKFIPQGGYMLKDNKVYYVDRADFAKVGINKAYIDLSNVPAVNPSQPKHVRLMAGDIATGIDTIDDLTNSNQTIYNLSGQRLSKPVKGVNIVNGKKVLVK